VTAALSIAAWECNGGGRSDTQGAGAWKERLRGRERRWVAGVLQQQCNSSGGADGEQRSGSGEGIGSLKGATRVEERVNMSYRCSP
jgi:hypothetical protein